MLMAVITFWSIKVKSNNHYKKVNSADINESQKFTSLVLGTTN